MAGHPIHPQTHKLILDYHAQGMSNRKIQKILESDHQFRMGRGSINKYVKLGLAPEVSSAEPPVNPPLDPPSEVIPKEISPAELSAIVSNKKMGEFNWREWIPTIQAMQALKRKGSFSQDTLTIKLGNGRDPIALASLSDMHMGAWSSDYNCLCHFTDEIINTENLYAALLGDYAHYAIKLRNVLEVSDNILPPEQQTQFLKSWFDEIWHKVAFATWENHGVERQEMLSGESSTKELLSKKVPYFNGIGHVDLQVGEQLYKGAVSHTFRGRSFLNPVHSMMRYMRHEGVDREWAMAGDSHVPGMMKYTDGEKVRAVVNAGSTQLNSGYAKRYFSLTTHPVYPILVFHADQHMITPFWSIKEWLATQGKGKVSE